MKEEINPKMRLTERQQLVKLSMSLKGASKEVLNAFIPAFYQASFMIPIYNPAFAWLLSNGIVNKDGFVLFNKNQVQQAINYEVSRRNDASTNIQILKQYAHKDFGMVIINVVNPKARTISFYSHGLGRSFKNVSFDEFERGLF